MTDRLESLVAAYRNMTGEAPPEISPADYESDLIDQERFRSEAVIMFENSQFISSLLRDGKQNDVVYAGKLLTASFCDEPEATHINLAITFLEHAIRIISLSEAEARSEALQALGLAFYLRFNRYGDLEDLNKAVENQQKAVSIASDDDPLKPTYLANLGNSFSARFEQTGQVDDLTQAITVQEQGLSLLPDGSSDKPAMLHNLSASFKSKFKVTGNMDHFHEAIRSQETAVSLAPMESPFRPLMLSNLGSMLGILYDETEDPDDLERAIEYQKEALKLISETDPERPRMLSNLGSSLDDRFRITEAADDIQESIQLLQEAANLTSDDNPGRSSILHKLGEALQSRFIYTGSESDLQEAIRLKEKGAFLLSDDHPSKPFYLSSLGTAYRKQFTLTGSLGDIDKAIQTQQKALSLCKEDDIDRRNYLNNLGVSYMTRYHHTEALQDLEEAIKHFQHAMSTLPDDSPDKSRMLNNLGTALETHFEKTANFSDLEEAIKYHRQALSLIANESGDKPGMLLNLGNTLVTQFNHTKQLSVLEEAIKYMEEAAVLTTNSAEHRPGIRSTLGNAFETKYQYTKAPDDLKNAVDYQEQALHFIPEVHAARPGLLTNLANSVHTQFEATGEIRYLEQSIIYYRSAATSNIGPPLVRFKAARRWSELASEHNLPLATEAYTTAMNLIPQIAWIGEDISRRHAQLAEIGDFPRAAAAYALQAQTPDLALEWLEQGRSIIWNQLLSLHTPIDDLQATHPDIASEFMELSRTLYNAGVQSRERQLLADDDELTAEEESRQHHRLAEKWESLLGKIRLYPGFEDFLLPKRLPILLKAATGGPIVVINVHQSRCDALILEPGKDHVNHISLKSLRYEDVQKMQETLRKNLANHNLRSREARAGGAYPGMAKPQLSSLGIMLSDMYKKIVQPILEGLGLTTSIPNRSKLPRVWWCPTGPLTFLPLHAASQDIQRGGDETSKYVVSSYIPTVNALLEAKTARRQPAKRFLGIAMTRTPNLASLPNAETELKEIRKSFNSEAQREWNYLEFQNEEATAEKVLSEMAESTWVHLACHAVQDISDPTQSGLCLHDQRLDILDIIAKPFPNADLAFLSACETATGDEKTSDEALHITGGMLGAGYRGVIGTMWSIPDEAAPLVASNVYKSLLSGGNPNSEQAAYALHDAVKELRKSGAFERPFHAWAPFVHFGV